MFDNVLSTREVPRRSQLRKEGLPTPRRMEKVPFHVINRGIAISDTFFWVQLQSTSICVNQSINQSIVYLSKQPLRIFQLTKTFEVVTPYKLFIKTKLQWKCLYAVFSDGSWARRVFDLGSICMEATCSWEARFPLSILLFTLRAHRVKGAGADIDKSLDLEKISKRNDPDFSLSISRNEISFLFLFSIFKIFKIFRKYFSFSSRFLSWRRNISRSPLDLWDSSPYFSFSSR